MPLTEKGREIERHMENEYGPKKGKEVFYASRNKGTITGVDRDLAEQRASDGQRLADMNRKNRERWPLTPLPQRRAPIGDQAGGIVDERFGRRP